MLSHRTRLYEIGWNQSFMKVIHSCCQRFQISYLIIVFLKWKAHHHFWRKTRKTLLVRLKLRCRYPNKEWHLIQQIEKNKLTFMIGQTTAAWLISYWTVSSSSLEASETMSNVIGSIGSSRQCRPTQLNTCTCPSRREPNKSSSWSSRLSNRTTK